MKTRLLAPLALLAALAVAIPTTGCTGTILDDSGQGGVGGGSDPSNPGGGGDDPAGAAACIGEGGNDSGEACDVTADCGAPLVCLDGACVGPKDPSATCDPAEGVRCANADEVCVAGLCVINPGTCTSVDECPLGYLCQGGSCVPERDGEACPSPGPGPELAGTWHLVSTLHLREALPGAVDSVLGVAETARNIITGNIDLGLPSVVEFFVGGVVSSIVRQFVPPWAQNLAVALGDLSDMLDDMKIESTVILDGQPCSGHYRGSERWDMLTFSFRGQEMRVPPSQLPGISEVVPEAFDASYSCGELFIDRHRVKQQMSGLVRFLLDTAAQAASGYDNVETALSHLVDCPAVASTLDDYVGSVCTFCPVITGPATAACSALVQQGVSRLGQAIDDASVKLSVITLKGIIDVAADGSSLSGGEWYGSLVGGDFPGEFSAQR
jgi:hypothetical protein